MSNSDYPLGTESSHSTSQSSRRASVGELVGQVSDQFSRLIRAEVSSYKSELKQKAARSGLGGGMLVAAGVLAFYLLTLLFGAAVAGFANLVPVWAAFLIVAGILAVVIVVLALVGKRELEQNKVPMPTEAVNRIKQDLNSVKKDIK